MKRPKILEEAGLDVYVDESKLRDLDIPVRQMQLVELEWLLDLPVWEMDGTDDWNLSPRDVLEGKPNSSTHKSVIENADLSHAIVIIHNRGKWIILDGFHRLAKAYQLKQSSIDVKILTSDMPAYQNALITKK